MGLRGRRSGSTLRGGGERGDSSPPSIDDRFELCTDAGRPLDMLSSTRVGLEVDLDNPKTLDRFDDPPLPSPAINAISPIETDLATLGAAAGEAGRSFCTVLSWTIQSFNIPTLSIASIHVSSPLAPLTAIPCSSRAIGARPVILRTNCFPAWSSGTQMILVFVSCSRSVSFSKEAGDLKAWRVVTKESESTRDSTRKEVRVMYRGRQSRCRINELE
jgi:hypothetical protein